MSSVESEVSPAQHNVSAAEYNLADDAPWKKIQKNTFTRWCNEHLRSVDKVINDLQFDLNDGLTLIALLEVLSHKRMSRKYHTRPTFRQMRLDNVSVALEFLEQEKIKLVSIDSKAIVDGNMKLILGLVWTLILHYSISSPLLEDGEAKKQTPELRLLGWIQDKVPELPITNFGQDWMDGKALGALVDGLAPGLCPDWESWDEVQRVNNAREAMQQADEWLGVPQVIAPEEIIDPGVDEQSIMTYLSMFPKAKLKPGAPLKPKSVSKPKACRASGRGLQPKGVRVGQVADFKVDTSRAGPGDLEVHIRGPDGFDVPVKQKETKEDIYALQYEPSIVGNYIIEITWAGEHIFKSPFEVEVGRRAGPQMIQAWGPGLKGGTVDMSADFVVESIGADAGLLGFAIEGPSQARIECDDQDDGSCNVRFWPTEPGEYAVHVTCDEEEIEDSPFMSCISPKKKKCYPHKVKVFGPGVSQIGFILNSQMEFTVDARFAGDGSLGIQALSMGGGPVNVEVMRKEHGLYTCFYTPTIPAKLTIFVTWGGVSVPDSPFRVIPGRIRIEPSFNAAKMKSKGSAENGEEMDLDLANSISTDSLFKLDLNVTSPTKMPADASKVKAYGPGLDGGFVGTPADFTIDTSASGNGRLSVTVDGVCPTKIKCSDNQDGTCTVTYLPNENGEHLINILFQGLHIPGSPFHADIQMPFDPSKVVVSGPGLKKGKVGQPCVVNIDCGLAGLGEFSVEAVSESGQKAKAKVQANKDGTYTAVYVPLTAGVYTLRLKYGGKVVANFPSEVVVDPAVYTSQVKVCGKRADGKGELNGFEGNPNLASVFASGIGLLQGLTGESNHFTITTGSAAAGSIAVTMEGPSDAKVSCTESNDGCYGVQYTPSVPGLYDVNITCGGEHILGSPFKVPVMDASDAKDVKISGPGLGSGVCAKVPQTFTIDCSKTGDAPESVVFMTPNGKIEHIEVKDNGDGTFSVAYSPTMEGEHSLVVKYADEEAFSSPIAFNALPTKDANKVKISVPGLESGACAQIPQTFMIDSSKTGEAPESVAIMTPNGKMELVEVTDNGDGTFSVAYTPSMEGAHSLVVKYANEDDFSRPYNFHVLPTNDANKPKVSGPGLESGLCVRVPQTFTIDCSKTGESPESVAVVRPNGKIEPVEVTDNGNGTYSVAYTPSMEGAHSLVVKYPDEDEYFSPCHFQVLPNDSSGKVKVSAPGMESGVCAQIPQTFTIDCSKTGEAPESVAIMTPNGKMEPVKVTDNGDGTFSVAYSPSMDGAHFLMVKCADEEEFSNLSNFQVLPTNDANKLKVSGPGLESGLCAKVPQIFTIDCSKTGEAPESVAVMTPNGKMEFVEVTDNGDGTYSVAYTPFIEGAHSLLVKYAEEEGFCSSYQFQVLPNDSSRKVKVSVPGLESGVCAQIPQTFTIDCSKTGEAPESVAVMTPSGKIDLADITDNGDGTYSVAYSPSMDGAHSLLVKYADEDEFSRLANFQVLPTNDANKLKVSGPGLKSGLYAKVPQTFTIDCSKTGEAPESVAIMTPKGKMELVEVTDNGDGTYSVAYTPYVEGSHSLVVRYANEDEFCSPYQFEVLPNDSSRKVEVSVPGLESGVCAQIPQAFTISCSKTGEAPESVAVMTPSGKIDLADITDNGDGTYSVAYSPSTDGAHSLLVKYADEDEFSRLANFQVLPTNDANKLKVSGPGLKSGLYAKVPQTFTIDCSKTGEAPESVAIMTPNGKMELVEVTDNGDGTYSVAYTPYVEGSHSLVVRYVNEDEFCSPYQFEVLPNDSSRKVEVSVPGLESGVCAQIPQAFTISCSKTGEAPESVAVMTPSGKIDLADITDNGDGTFSVAYSPSTDGAHSLLVKYADEDEFSRLANFQVLPTNDANKLKVSGPGLESGLCTKVPQTFTIDCSKTGEAPESVAVMTPNGKMELVEVTDNGDGTYSVAYTPYVEGSHSLVVRYANEDEFCSPYQFEVLPNDSSRKVKVSVPGPESGVCAQIPQAFTISCSKTGEAPESVSVMTPSGKIDLADITDNGDGTYSVAYSPSTDGAHSLLVKYADEDEFSRLANFKVLPTNDANKLKVSGPGLKSGLYAKVPQTFTIDCSKTGEAPESVAIMTPNGKMELVEVTDNGDGTYSVAYTPYVEGSHSLVVRYANEDEFCSPYQFEVLPNDSSRKVEVSVPGLESGVCAQIPQAFTISCSKTGEAPESVSVMTPSGKIDLADITDNGDGTFSVAYSPSTDGAHSLLVKYADEDEFSRLANFQVLPTNDANKLKVSGPGLESGLCTKVPQTFTIDCSKTGEAPESVAVMTPNGKMELVEVTDNGDGTYSVAYTPYVEGSHSLVVRYADEDEFCSPYQFEVLPNDSSKKVKASVPGLESGVCAQNPQAFTISCSKTGEAPESVAVMTPSGKIVLADITDNGDGTYSVAYSPSTDGAHSLLVKYADEDEFSSLANFQVLPTNDANKLKVSGPGLDSGLCAKVPQTFTIDCSKTGEAPESVAVMTPNGQMELVGVTDNGDGTFSVAFSPSVEGAHSIMVKYNDEDDFFCLSNLQVLPTNDANKLKVSGPGLESGLCAKVPQTFTIDCSKAGEAPESVAVMNPNGKMELVEVTDNGDGTFSVAYTPSVEGAHSLVVKYTEEDEFCCPYQFHVLPNDSSRKVKVSVPGLESGVCAQIPQTFTIDCSKTGEAPESVAVMTPSGQMELVEVTDNGDGTFSVAYSPSVEGAHSVMVKYNDEDNFCCLSNFQVLPTNDANKLKVSGPRPEAGLCAKDPQTFTIDCSKSGEAPESVAVMTPNGKMELVEVTDNGDGTYSVAYTPSMKGAHSLVVKYPDEDEFCSPYQFEVSPKDSSREVQISVPGLESGVCAQIPQTFTIDYSKTGEAPESVAIMTPSGQMEFVEFTDNGDGTFSVAFSPSVEGAHSVMVKYNNEDDFCSLSHFQVLPTNDANKMKVSGPGLEAGLCAKVPQTFTIDCNKTGEAPESLAVMTPNGKMELVEVTDNGDGTYSVVFTPSMEGAHSLVVKYPDEDEFCSPYNFHVLPTNDANKQKVSGPGQESGLCVKVPQTFTINCSKTGEAPESVAVVMPNGKIELVEVTENIDGNYSAAFSPLMEGTHSLVVKYADEDEFHSPYQFQVLPSDSNRNVKVSLPGLESGVCAQIPQTFTIDCCETGEAPESAAIMTPSGKIELLEVTENRDGTYSVAYSPSMDGAHSLMVKYTDEDDFRCFSNFQVLPTNDTNKLKVSSPGLESGVCAKIPQTFTIDCSKTGEAPESLAVMTPSGMLECVEVTDNGDGTYSVAYIPSMEGAHSLLVKYADEEEFCNPYQFQVLPNDSSRKVKVSVPGLESGVCAQIPQTFTIDCSKTGEAPESVAIMFPSGQMEVLEVTDNGNGTYSVAYSPSVDGAHSVMVKYADEDEFSSLSNFHVLPTNDANKLKVSGPGLLAGLCAKVPQNITIDCSKTGEAPEFVAVMTPNCKMELVEVTDNGDGTYTVAYSPSLEGVHSLVVKYADEDEFCSPYNFHVLPTNDASNMKISGPGLESKVCAKVAQTFTIDCSKTGEAPESVAMVMPNGKVELVEVKDCGDGTYTVAWSPTMDGPHSLVVKYTDEDDYCCPFQFHAASAHDARKVRVSGPGLLSGLPASLHAHFSVDTTEAGEGELSVKIVDPEGRSKRPIIHDNCDGTYEVSYVPDKVGGYKITIEYSGDEIPTSPYHVWAVATGDADKCIVTGPELGSVIGAGEDIGFVVNTQSAGTGKVSCMVLTPDGTEVEADVTEREDGTFEICYTATQPGDYIISAGFGGESLFISPFQVMAPDDNLEVNHQVSHSRHKALPRDGPKHLMKHGSYIPLSGVNQHTGLMPFDMVMAPGLADGEIIGEVHMPSGGRSQAEVIDNGDGTVTLMYDPTEEGLHQMHITVNGTPVPESPLQFYVNNGNSKEPMAHGSGLTYGISNEIAAFTIFNKNLVQGELDIALEGPCKAEIHCLNNRDGTCTVTYLPTKPGDYTVLVRHNDEHITGSPFTAKIAGPRVESGSDVSQLRSQVSLGTVADFTLDITEEDISLLTASIISPSGLDVSCLLKRQPDSHIGISFIPKEVGEHLVSVMKDGEHVANSPIPLTITPSEIGDASRVKVFGSGLAKGHTYEMSDFVVDTREAGYGGLTLAIEGPSNVEIQTEELEDGTCGVSFCPSEPGAYIVSVKFSEEHVPGSPFTAVVTESGHMRESITHYQGAATITSIGNVCGINLKIPGLDLQHISAEVSSPLGATKEAIVTITGRDIYSVSFVPSETGVHAVSVWYKGQPIPGSPYHYTVGPLGEGGPEKVQAWGLGLQSAESCVPADFSIWAREAGPGNLSVTMEGPGRAELVFEDRADGSCGISYTATEPGDYEVAVKFNDEHIQDSPFLVPVYVPADDAMGQIKLTNHQMNGLISVCEMSSPWPSFLSDASKVVTTGQGLRRAFVGKKNVFTVDCSNAGTNLLLVGMHGPTIPCEEVSIKYLGNYIYDISYVVREKGNYILAVKWGEEHIPGSPFHVFVA